MNPNEECFTIGQITKRGLLLGKRGGAIKNKTTVSQIVRTMAFKEVQTINGLAKCVTQAQIDEYNAKILVS